MYSPPCRKTHVIFDNRLEEVHNLLVFDILGAVAWNIERAEAGSVLAELMSPKVAVGRTLGDPVLVHVGEKVVLAEWCKEGGDAGPIVGDHWSTRRSASGSVGRGSRIILPRKVTVLGVRAIAVVWPQAVNCLDRLAEGQEI